MLLRTLKKGGIGFCLTAASLFSGLAQPAPKLDSISGSWFQRGTTNEISVRGEALSEVREVLLSGTGISAAIQTSGGPETILEGSAGGLTSGQADKGRLVRMKVVVKPDAPLGGRELRLAGLMGVSNPVNLQISDVREFVEKGPNNQISEAAWVDFPGAISGVIGGGAESDFYRFKAHRGERWIFDVQANRNGSPLDANLELFNARGNSLAKSEDVHGLDPFIEHAMTEDGEYLIQIRDLRFQGGGDYKYRIVAGPFPYLDYLFPFGGRRGSSIDVVMKGRNLEGADKVSLRIAPDAPIGRQDVRAHTSRGYSNGLPFEAGTLPEIMESEGNDTREKGASIPFPVVVNGRVDKAGDVDFYRFKVPSDGPVAIEIQARRFSSPLDALLTLMDSKGGILQRNDDSDGPDAKIQFDAKKDTDYFISVRDLTDRGGEMFGYRMVLNRPETVPDYSVRVIGGRFRVARGGSVPVRCEVDRRNGFDGLIRVMPQDLPRGVTSSPLILGPGASFGWLVITAAPDAEPGYGPLKITATSENVGKPVIRPAQPQEQSWLTVLESSPFTLDVSPATLVAEQNSTVVLDVSLTRLPGFNGEVKFFTEELPGIKASSLTFPSGQSRGKLSLEIKYDSEPGSRPLMIRGEGSQDGSTFSVHAPAPVMITTHRIAMFLTAMLPGSPFFRTDAVKLSAVALRPGSESQANSTEFVVKVDRRDMTNEVALVLEGLPSGVTATLTNIVSGVNEAPVKLLVTEKAEAGKEHTFYVVGTTTHGDRIWRQKTQAISLKIEAQEKEAQAAKTTTVSASK